jgi:hypothetical protein
LRSRVRRVDNGAWVAKQVSEVVPTNHRLLRGVCAGGRCRRTCCGSCVWQWVLTWSSGRCSCIVLLRIIISPCLIVRLHVGRCAKMNGSEIRDESASVEMEGG